MDCEDSALEEVLKKYQLPVLRKLNSKDMPAYTRQIENAVFAAAKRIEIIDDQMQSAIDRLCDYVASLIGKVPKEKRELICYLKDASDSEENYLEVNLQNICKLNKIQAIEIFGNSHKEVLEKAGLVNQLYDVTQILKEAQQQYLGALMCLTKVSMPFEQKNNYGQAQVYVVHDGNVYKFMIDRKDSQIFQDLEFMVREDDFKKEGFMQKLKTAYERYYQNVYVANNASELISPASIISCVSRSLQGAQVIGPNLSSFAGITIISSN